MIDAATMPDRRRALRRMTGVALVGVLAACAARPARIEPVERVQSSTQPVTGAPPSELQEQPPPPPSSDAFWISGHWRWEGPGYVWYPGHWGGPRPGYVFARAFWAHEGGYWVYRPGRWLAATQSSEFPEVVVAQPPPPIRAEVIGPAPGPGFFWLSGYSRWTGARHVWVAGRWEVYRPGFFWIAPYWARSGVNFRFMGGQWRRY